MDKDEVISYLEWLKHASAKERNERRTLLLKHLDIFTDRDLISDAWFQIRHLEEHELMLLQISDASLESKLQQAHSLRFKFRHRRARKALFAYIAALEKRFL